MTGDGELLGRCRSGDRSAWAQAYRESAPLVALFLRRLRVPDRDIDDLVQQVFATFFTTLDRYRGEGRISTWLYGIAAHLAARRRRAEFRWWRRREAVADDLASGLHGAVDPARGALARHALRVVQQALDDLPVSQRAVWVLREWEGLDTEEVGLALGLPLGTVRSRLCRARAAVIDALRATGFEDVAAASAWGNEAGTLPAGEGAHGNV